jgi:hypothetical protein
VSTQAFMPYSLATGKINQSSERSSPPSKDSCTMS